MTSTRRPEPASPGDGQKPTKSEAGPKNRPLRQHDTPRIPHSWGDKKSQRLDFVSEGLLYGIAWNGGTRLVGWMSTAAVKKIRRRKERRLKFGRKDE